MPTDSDEVQCSVCGELLRPYKEQSPLKRAFEAEPAANTADSAASSNGPKLELSPGMTKIGVIWMVCCVAFSLMCIGFAFYEYSIEAMWASFIAAGLAGLPILYLILGRTVEVAYWYRRELTIVAGIAGAIFCVYLIAQAITKSNMRVETAGMQEMVTNENFTKTLITAIICLALVVVMIPTARMLMKSSTMKSFTNRYEIDSKQDTHTRTSENVTSLELRRLELAHEAELRRLEIERERVQIEAERVHLLTNESRLLLTNQAGSSGPGPHHPDNAGAHAPAGYQATPPPAVPPAGYPQNPYAPSNQSPPSSQNPAHSAPAQHQHQQPGVPPYQGPATYPGPPPPAPASPPPPPYPYAPGAPPPPPPSGA